MRRVGFGVRLRVLGPVRAISGTALFKQRYPLPANATAHPVCDLLDDVKQGVALLQAGSAREGSTLLERGAAIGRSAFGDASEFQVRLPPGFPFFDTPQSLTWLAALCRTLAGRGSLQ